MDSKTNRDKTIEIIENHDSHITISDDEIIQEKVPTRNNRRSSIFALPNETNVDVDIPNANKIHYPPDYFQKLQQEHTQWKMHIASLRNEILELKKSLQGPKTVVPLSILDKEQQDFFKDVPALYSKYLEDATEHCENLQIMAVIYGNMLTYTSEMFKNMQALTMHAQEQLQYILGDMHSDKNENVAASK